MRWMQMGLLNDRLMVHMHGLNNWLGVGIIVSVFRCLVWKYVLCIQFPNLGSAQTTKDRNCTKSEPGQSSS
jgi:hypothetical protein